MRTALYSLFFAVLISPGAIAQQEPPTTPPPNPPAAAPTGDVKPSSEAKVSDPKGGTPKGKAEESATKNPGIDPARMAEPKAGEKRNAGGAVDDKSYVLGAEDQITILVNGSPEFNGNHLIRPDGRITVNLVGEVMAAGLTPDELTTSLKEKIKKYVLDPDVTISVVGVNSKRYFIQGEVNKPGEYKLVVPTKVLEALVNAGGFRDFARTKKIVVIREEAGLTKRLNFNYNEVILGKHLDQNVYLKPGDIIVVR